MKTVGEKIAELRKQKNMTQEEFGSMLGISAQSISKWENNVSLPDITLIPIIADSLISSLTHFLTEAQTYHPSKRRMPSISHLNAS